MSRPLPPTKGNLMPLFAHIDQAVGIIQDALVTVEPDDPWNGAEDLVEALSKLDSALTDIKRALSKRPDE